MFYWCCADFSNMAGLFGGFIGKAKEAAAVEDAEKQRIRRWRDEQEERDAQFTSIFTYNSQQNYGNVYGADFGGTSPPMQQQIVSAPENLAALTELTLAQRLLEGTCTALSSTFLLLTLPFTLPFSVKFVAPSERLVVMRLGRTKGVHGPGTVLVLPWIDKATSVDLRVTTLELPTIQLITADRGLLELAAVLFIQITDPLTAHCAIQNIKETLHSLAYTTLNRQLCKRMLSDLTNPASLAKVLAKCQDELNVFVRPRGVHVERITVTRTQVHKEADNAAASVFNTLARSELGKQLFGQIGQHLGQQQQRQAATTCGLPIPTVPEVIIDIGADENSEAAPRKEFSPPSFPLALDSDLVALLAQIRAVLTGQLVQRVQRLFRVQCSTGNGSATPPEFDIDLRGGTTGWCGWTWERSDDPSPDVHFTLDKWTLLALVDGSATPMGAYLDGRVQIRGSVQDAILLKHLADAMVEQKQKKTTTMTAGGMAEIV